MFNSLSNMLILVSLKWPISLWYLPVLILAKPSCQIQRRPDSTGDDLDQRSFDWNLQYSCQGERFPGGKYSYAADPLCGLLSKSTQWECEREINKRVVVLVISNPIQCWWTFLLFPPHHMCFLPPLHIDNSIVVSWDGSGRWQCVCTTCECVCIYRYIQASEHAGYTHMTSRMYSQIDPRWNKHAG